MGKALILTAAYQVVESEDLASLFQTNSSIGPEFRPQFTDEDMVALREVRFTGKDIDYLIRRYLNSANCPMPM